MRRAEEARVYPCASSYQLITRVQDSSLLWLTSSPDRSSGSLGKHCVAVDIDANKWP